MEWFSSFPGVSARENSLNYMGFTVSVSVVFEQ